MLNPQFCCCAIPLVNAGIYALLSEQFALSVLAGVLAIATPTIVGSYVPSYTPYILAALSFIIAATQIIGFYGVFKEQRRTYKFYAVANTILFAAAFVLAGALVGVSGARHDQAVTKCLAAYYGDGSSTTSEGKQVCEAFAWVDLGVMAGLWLLLFVVQTYLCFITRVYASNQKDEHQRYKSIYDANAEEFAMVEQMQRYGVPGDAWDHRPSLDSIAPPPDGFDRPYSYAPGAESESSIKYHGSGVVDGGETYLPHQPHQQLAAEEQYRPNEFASEAEYREYLQDQHDREAQAGGGGHGYPPHEQGYEDTHHAEYDEHDARYSAPQAQHFVSEGGPPGYSSPGYQAR